jgi:hypothetical protein
MPLTAIRDVILDESSSVAQLHAALDEFSLLASEISGVVPDPSFDAWAADTFLDQGVAINPQAAAHCVSDYQRSVVFIRAVYAAINAAKLRFPGEPIRLLYAGCGPYATLLLPLLGEYLPGELDICLLDVHQRSLDSVNCLIGHFGFKEHGIELVCADACRYQHAVGLHLIVAETMQKSLEQEPQFAVTANLAPQLIPGGIFVPQEIEVTMELADLEHRSGQRVSLGVVFSLSAASAATQLRAGTGKDGCSSLELAAVRVEIPPLKSVVGLVPALFTRIRAFDRHRLREYEAEITLPLRCHDIAAIRCGDVYQVVFQTGAYPRFCVSLIPHRGKR